MSIVLRETIRAQAQAAAKSTVDGVPVANPYDHDTQPDHASAWEAEYEQAMCELDCFA